MEMFAIFVVCAVSGVFTGLLGIGGGLIIVPAFLTILPLFGINHFSIHEIIGVSATCVFFNSATSAFYRRKEDFEPKKFIIKASIAVIIGTLLGAYLSSFAPQKLLLLIYIAISLISIYLIKGDIYFNLENSRLKPLLYITFAFVGSISASIGIGGAILFATTLKCFLNKNTKKLLPTITLIVAIHALFAFIGKFLNGDVTLEIVPIAIIASILGSKIGVVVSKKLSSKTITNLMVAVLILALIRITIELF